MSADGRQAETAFRAAMLWGLLACGGVAVAAETDAPDLEFLEYLGSWEESDEDWILFTEEAGESKQAEDKDGNVPAPDGEKLAELGDES